MTFFSVQQQMMECNTEPQIYASPQLRVRHELLLAKLCGDHKTDNQKIITCTISVYSFFMREFEIMLFT